MKRIRTTKVKPAGRPCLRARVPSFEQCLTHILSCLECFTGVPVTISPKLKQRFKEVELHPERLTLPAYRRILRKLLDRQQRGTKYLREDQVKILDLELRTFLFRFEQLMLGLTVANASARQVRWSLCARYFVPWLALRIAFHLRQRSPADAEHTDDWFLPPIKGGRIGSCFWQLIDREVRKPRESDAELAQRLKATAVAGDRLDIINSVLRGFRHYWSGDNAASDSTLELILKATPELPNLHAKLILARAIDRNVHAALRSFGKTHALRLVRFFHLSFNHFRHLLCQLAAELPKDDEGAWLYLQSPTFTGNSPFEAERYHPLTDKFMHELARRISDELGCSARGGRLASVPTGKRAFLKGRFSALGHGLPADIQMALGRGDFEAAIAVSHSLYPEESQNALEAARIGSLFSRCALFAYEPDTHAGGLTPPKATAPAVLRESSRLFSLACMGSNGEQRTLIEIDFLRFLLEPHRPKQKQERPLARRLCRVAANHYRKAGRAGSAAFLGGLLLWLEGSKKPALRKFAEARQCGRASCGEDWIRLLRLAPLLAESLRARRETNAFAKLSERDGVSTGEPSPKTRMLAEEKMQRVSRNKFQIAFTPFPT